MSNITNLNRDYLIKINVKEATIDVPKMTFWNTDKKTSNMFVQLVINMSENELIKNYVTIENATDYKIVLNVIKPKTNQYRTFEAKLLNEEKALFEIDLTSEFIDQVGNYNFEFEVSSKVDNNDESITTSSSTYEVKGSILTNLNQEISSSPDLPILKQLIEQVKSLQGGDLTGYQKKSDNSLETTSKEVVGAINEVNSQFKDITKNKVDKTNLEYINVLDLGIAPKVNFDNTSLFNDAINKGIKNFYFPPGIYELNLIISTPYIRIKGGGIGKTIFSPHIDKDVINLQYVDNSINNCEIRDIEIKNKEFTNNNGLSINGNDKGVNAINDNHYLKNLKISNFLNGIFIKDRTTFSKFENIEVSNNYNNGIRVDSINAATCFNGNGFYNIVMAHNINEGLYINTTRNGADFSHIALTNNFINCDVEDNANSENTTRFYGIYVTDVDNINLQGCYIENNAQKSDNGINLYFDGAFCRGINISGTLVWGSKYALKVTDKCKILSGEVSASNKIRGIIDINDKPHNSESGFIIGCALTEGYDNVKKLDKVLLANSSTTLNPFSIGISHDSTATPSVKRSNYITTFTSNEITNFTDGVLGQIVIVRPYGNAILTFNNGTYIQLKDNNTCTIKSNQTITFMKYGDKWVELFRNV